MATPQFLCTHLFHQNVAREALSGLDGLPSQLGVLRERVEELSKLHVRSKGVHWPFFGDGLESYGEARSSVNHGGKQAQAVTNDCDLLLLFPSCSSAVLAVASSWSLRLSLPFQPPSKR